MLSVRMFTFLGVTATSFSSGFPSAYWDCVAINRSTVSFFTYSHTSNLLGGIDNEAVSSADLVALLLMFLAEGSYCTGAP
jgi:hypothetical protein